MDWIEIVYELPEAGGVIVTAADYDNTGTPIYDLVVVTEYFLENISTAIADGTGLTFSHWCDLTPPNFDSVQRAEI